MRENHLLAPSRVGAPRGPRTHDGTIIPTARAKAEEIKRLASEGLSMGQIAAQLDIGKGSVHRVLAA